MTSDPHAGLWRMTMPFLRMVLAAVLLVLANASAGAVDKAFIRDDLADAVIKLEAQIKTDTGTVTKSAPQLRRHPPLQDRQGQ